MRTLFLVVISIVALPHTIFAADAPQPEVPIEQLQKDAAAGDAKAMGTLGFKYLTGQGVKQDLAEAANWFRKSADAGNTEAMCNLGVLYQNGKGVTQDFAEAFKWFSKAAAAGDARGMYGLSILYRKG